MIVSARDTRARHAAPPTSDAYLSAFVYKHTITYYDII